MTVEDKIRERMSKGLSRLEAIASLNLGERSEAAIRVLQKRQERLDLVCGGLSFDEACTVVKLRYNQYEK